MKNIINKKIKGYSAMAGAVIYSGAAISEVAYTDIDPDYILDIDFEAATIDMNADDEVDFGFMKWSYYSFPLFGMYSYVAKLFAGPTRPENSVAGTSSIVYVSQLYYPYALSYGDQINAELSFQNWYLQRMAFKRFESIISGGGDTLTLQSEGGFWYPDVIDHYIGVRFLDMADKLHYGWIRCDVLDEASILIVKDFAYEKFPNTSIRAGDKIGDTTQLVLEDGVFNTEVESISTLSGLDIYSFGQTIYINNQSGYNNLQLSVFDTGGKLLKTGIAGKELTVLTLDEAAGIYFVQIENDELQFTKSVIID